MFQIYDYKKGFVLRKVFGFPLVCSDNTLTLLVFGLPLVQKKFFYTPYSTGGGG